MSTSQKFSFYRDKPFSFFIVQHLTLFHIEAEQFALNRVGKTIVIPPFSKTEVHCLEQPCSHERKSILGIHRGFCLRPWIESQGSTANTAKLPVSLFIKMLELNISKRYSSCLKIRVRCFNLFLYKIKSCPQMLRLV